MQTVMRGGCFCAVLPATLARAEAIGMTRKIFWHSARQLSDLEKRRRADFVIPTGLGRALKLAFYSRNHQGYYRTVILRALNLAIFAQRIKMREAVLDTETHRA